MSNKREREKRREERIQAESKAESGDRRTRMLQLGAGAVFIAIVAVVVVIVIASSGGDESGGNAEELAKVSEVNSSLSGVPQEGMVLGDPNAPVELVEFGDLQCPVCKVASEEVLPPLIEGQVEQGQAKLVFKNFTIISEESIPAGQAAVAAGMQDVGWNFLEVFYRNQGEERSGYVTDEFLTAVAEAAGVPDIEQWNEDRDSAKVKKEVEQTAREAQQLGFTGTPSYAIDGPGTNGLEPIGNVGSAGELESAIDAAS
ncbi:MAG: thioredoxin domain-containing protein [Solirubrobacterales bacterium]